MAGKESHTEEAEVAHSTSSGQAEGMKFPAVCLKCWRVQETRKSGVCQICHRGMLQPVILPAGGSHTEGTEVEKSAAESGAAA